MHLQTYQADSAVLSRSCTKEDKSSTRYALRLRPGVGIDQITKHAPAAVLLTSLTQLNIELKQEGSHTVKSVD